MRDNPRHDAPFSRVEPTPEQTRGVGREHEGEVERHHADRSVCRDAQHVLCVASELVPRHALDQTSPVDLLSGAGHDEQDRRDDERRELSAPLIGIVLGFDIIFKWPLVSGLGFIFAGATGILYLPAYLTRERPAIRMIAALVALVIFAITG